MADDEAQKPAQKPEEEKKPAAKSAGEKAPAAKQDEAPAEGGKAEAPAVKPVGEAPRAESEKKPGEDKPVGEKGAGKDVFVSLGLEEAEGAPKILKAKGSKNVHTGIVHVLATFNNTIVTITDVNGNVIGWSSSGKMGFRGSRKSTAYASQLVSQDACRQAMGHGLRQVEVRVKGPGAGRESAIRAVQAIGIEITMIKDVTPIPHNGCRPPKARRV